MKHLPGDGWLATRLANVPLREPESPSIVGYRPKFARPRDESIATRVLAFAHGEPGQAAIGIRHHPGAGHERQ